MNKRGGKSTKKFPGLTIPLSALILFTSYSDNSLAEANGHINMNFTWTATSISFVKWSHFQDSRPHYRSWEAKRLVQQINLSRSLTRANKGHNRMLPAQTDVLGPQDNFCYSVLFLSSLLSPLFITPTPNFILLSIWVVRLSFVKWYLLYTEVPTGILQSHWWHNECHCNCSLCFSSQWLVCILTGSLSMWI